MRTTIYWFSSTGNSLVMARHLAARLGDTDLVPITAALRQPVTALPERVGIIFPVYIWGQPLIVNRFVASLPPAPTTYFFAVATCGGMPGATVKQTRRMLKARGNTLAAGFTMHLPGNYTPLYGAPAPAKQQKLFTRAAARADVIAAYIQAGKRGRFETSFFLANWICSGLIYRSINRLPGTDVDFTADATCNGCGVCARVCPVANITLTDGRPVWQHHCEHCMGCLQWCPETAIQFGRKTRGRARYHHPEITVKDLAGP